MSSALCFRKIRRRSLENGARVWKLNYDEKKKNARYMRSFSGRFLVRFRKDQRSSSVSLFYGKKRVMRKKKSLLSSPSYIEIQCRKCINTIRHTRVSTCIKEVRMRQFSKTDDENLSASHRRDRGIHSRGSWQKDLNSVPDKSKSRYMWQWKYRDSGRNN